MQFCKKKEEELPQVPKNSKKNITFLHFCILQRNFCTFQSFHGLEL